LEAVMVICFGLSWPLSILKSLRARTAKGKSLFFLCAIGLGYAAGIAAKLLSGNITYVFVFYVINQCMVLVDIALYFRNRRLDRGLRK
jgi:bacteriorhodopsin